MWDGEFQKHTTCISEAEKYEKSLYKGDKKKGKGQQQQQQQQQKQNAQAPQQSQPKPAKTAEAAPATAAPVPSTSVAIDNGTSESRMFALKDSLDKWY